MRIKLLLIWDYLSEALLAFLYLLVLLKFFNISTLAFFVLETSSAWANMLGILFAASLTIWVTFTGITATDFGGYLKDKNCYSYYSYAFIYALSVFFISSIVSIMSIGIDSDVFRLISLYLIIYSILNVVSMVKNASGLVNAYAIFLVKASKSDAFLAEKNSNK